MNATVAARHPEILIAPLVTFVAVVALLALARVYERLPVQAPECGFKARTGIPCLSCGGTRAMMSLSRGEVFQAVAFNPGVVLGVALSGIWFFAGIVRFRRGDEPLPVAEQNRKLKRALGIAGVIAAVNWVYLVIFLE